MSEVDPCADLKPIDELLERWTENEANICWKQDMVKKYRILTGLIEDYRRKACDLMTVRHHVEQIIVSIDKLLQMNHKLTQDLGSAHDAFCKRWAENARELDRLASGAGFATQALVTRWLHEVGFRIADIEVEHEDDVGEHSFDIEIEAGDGDGRTWDVEVWQGTGPLAHEEQFVKRRALVNGDRILCNDEGAWDERMKYISEYGGIGDDADANFRTLMKKMGQMRKDHTGVVVACIQRDLKPDVTLIPKEWGPRLPENRCVIVLRIGDGGWTEERRGTGYLVCSPKFAHAEAAKTVIESLKFEYVDYPTQWKYKWWEQ